MRNPSHPETLEKPTVILGENSGNMIKQHFSHDEFGGNLGIRIGIASWCPRDEPQADSTHVMITWGPTGCHRQAVWSGDDGGSPAQRLWTYIAMFKIQAYFLVILPGNGNLPNSPCVCVCWMMITYWRCPLWWIFNFQCVCVFNDG